MRWNMEMGVGTGVEARTGTGMAMGMGLNLGVGREIGTGPRVGIDATELASFPDRVVLPPAWCSPRGRALRTSGGSSEADHSVPAFHCVGRAGCHLPLLPLVGGHGHGPERSLHSGTRAIPSSAAARTTAPTMGAPVGPLLAISFAQAP